MTDSKKDSGTRTPTRTSKKTGKKTAAKKVARRTSSETRGAPSEERVASADRNQSSSESKPVSTDTAPGKNASNDIAPESNAIRGSARDAGGATTNIASAPASPGQSSGSVSGVVWIALVCSLFALAASGYAWYQTAVNARITGGEQGSRLGVMEQKLVDYKDIQSGATGQIDQIKQRVADSETIVADQVSQVKQLVSSTESGLGSQISELKQLIAKSETMVGEQIRTIFDGVAQQQKQVQGRLDESGQELKAQAQAFRDEFDNLANSIGELKNELGTSVEGWSMREIEHLLVIANQRVQLGQDINAARVALKIADGRLQDIDNPALLGTRQAISTEIAALDAIKPVDFGGISNTLTLLSNTIGNLPLIGVGEAAGPVRPAPGEVGSDAAAQSQSTGEMIADVGRNFFADLGSLVQVEKGGKPVAPNITAEIKLMILAKGRLMLEGAQIALLRQEPEVFLDRLTATEAWVSEKFDTGNDQTIQWLEQLASLKPVSPQVEYPDISGSLNALRSVIGSEG